MSARRQSSSRVFASDLLNGFNLIWVVQSSREKYFAFSETQIRRTTLDIPRPQEGRIAIVTDVGAGCGGRGSVGRVSGRRASRTS